MKRSKQMVPGRDPRGDPFYTCSCGDCGHSEDVRATIGQDGKQGEGQVIRKLSKSGWSYVKHVLRCPECTDKRKEFSMAKSKADPAPEPSRAQKRAILDLLEEAYDTERGCYRQGDTDATVAAVLDDDIRPGWVAKLREEFFGPEGANEDIEKLISEVELALHEAEDQSSRVDVFVQKAVELEKGLEASRESLKAMRADLIKIKQAVGPHTLRLAHTS